MSIATYFVQECPTCGRPLQVSVKYLGKTMVCEHCRGHFVARDPAGQPHVLPKSGLALMERVDQLLASAKKRTIRVSRA